MGILIELPVIGNFSEKNQATIYSGIIHACKFVKGQREEIKNHKNDLK